MLAAQAHSSVHRSNHSEPDQRNHQYGRRSEHFLETLGDGPATGEQVEVLWVKGSGGDLRTSLRENFSRCTNPSSLVFKNPTPPARTIGLRDHGRGYDGRGPTINHINLNTARQRRSTHRCTRVFSRRVRGSHCIQPIISIAASARWQN